jgi:hypothetical protein
MFKGVRKQYSLVQAAGVIMKLHIKRQPPANPRMCNLSDLMPGDVSW